MAAILKASDKHPVRRGTITLKTGLGDRTVLGQLDRLRKSGLVRLDENRRMWQATDKGRSLLAYLLDMKVKTK